MSAPYLFPPWQPDPWRCHHMPLVWSGHSAGKQSEKKTKTRLLNFHAASGMVLAQSSGAVYCFGPVKFEDVPFS